MSTDSTELFCDELRRVVQNYLQREGPDQTLSPSELINEAHGRLLTYAPSEWFPRKQLVGSMAKAMRQVLVDFARQRRRETRTPLDSVISQPPAPEVNPVFAADIVDLDGALNTLEHLDGRKAKVIELYYFAGLSCEDVADVLDISVTTVARDLRFAEAWLCREVSTDRARGAAGAA